MKPISNFGTAAFTSLALLLSTSAEVQAQQASKKNLEATVIKPCGEKPRWTRDARGNPVPPPVEAVEKYNECRARLAAASKKSQTK